MASQKGGPPRGTNWSLWVVLICLLAFAANAFGAYYLFLPISLVLLAVFHPRRVVRTQVDFNVILLIIFAVAYALPGPSSPVQVLLNFLYPVAYVVGVLAVKTGCDPYARFRHVIITLVAGTAAHGVLNAITNMRSYGWAAGQRVLPDFWTQVPLTATLQATLFIPLVGFAYYGLTTRQRHRSITVLLTVFALIVAVAYNLFTASRTIFVVMLLTIVACMLVPNGRRVHRILSSAGIAAVVGGFYGLDALGLRSLVSSSPLVNRYSSGQAPRFGDDPRLERWRYVMDHFWDHTSGGLHFRTQVGYAHNLWLDAYDVAGLMAFLSLVGFTLGALVLLRKVLVHENMPVGFRVLVVGLWVAMLAQFMTEPILDGMPMLLGVFCVMCGAAAELVRDTVGIDSGERTGRSFA